MIGRRLILALVAASGALFPFQASAQVRLLGTVGLGRPLRPLDARARGLGGAAVVLHGGNLSAINPASLSRIASPGIWVSYQPESRTLEGDLASGDIETASFPLFRAALPLSPRLVGGAAFGGALNRNWGVQFTDTLSLSSGEEEFLERRTSDGGISQFRLEAGYLISQVWTVGAAAQYYFGESRLEVIRDFVDPAYRTTRTANAVRYSGWGVTVGTEFQPTADLILGAVGAWGFGLNIRDDSTGAELYVDLPVGLDIGASWRIAPDLLFALALGWVNWSTLNSDLPQGGVSDAWNVGAGFEARALSRGNAWAILLRLGGSLERYPFDLGGGAPSERAVAFGLGAEFIGGRGRFDGAVELGKRGDAQTNDVEESFTRYTFSLAVFTN